MSSSAELHAVYKIANTPINRFPYPHFYIPEIFPADFYAQMQATLPDPGAMRPIEEVRPVRGYKERFVMGMEDDSIGKLPEEKQAFWRDLRAWLTGGEFASFVLNKFSPYVEERFKDRPDVRFHDEVMLVQDITRYSLGPHSDSPRKVVTFLFYLPKDVSQSHLGTSIYMPKDPRFRCMGGPHYDRANFQRMWTAPFMPNSLFAFFKTDNSFHGVEPVEDPDCRRWLMLYDIYQVVEPDKPLVPPSPTPA